MRLALKRKTLIPVCSAVLAVIWIYVGLAHHGFWDKLKGPLPGFVPSLMAGLMLFASIIGIVQSFKEKEEADRLENWVIVLASAMVIALVFLIGMIPSLMLFVFVWLRYYEKTNWKQTITVLIISFGIAYGVFVLWLDVPFPIGFIMNMITGGY